MSRGRLDAGHPRPEHIADSSVAYPALCPAARASWP